MVVIPSSTEACGSIEYDNSAHIDVDQLIKNLEFLIRWYGSCRSNYLVNNIVKMLELIQTRTDQQDGNSGEWNCHRQLKLWRFLAG